MFGFNVIRRFLICRKFSTDVINNIDKTNNLNNMNSINKINSINDINCLYCLFRSAGFYFLDGLDFTDKFDIRHLIER